MNANQVFYSTRIQFVPSHSHSIFSRHLQWFPMGLTPELPNISLWFLYDVLVLMYIFLLPCQEFSQQNVLIISVNLLHYLQNSSTPKLSSSPKSFVQMNLCFQMTTKSPTADTIRDRAGHLFLPLSLSSAVCGHDKFTVASGESYSHSDSDTSNQICFLTRTTEVGGSECGTVFQDLKHFA